MHWPKHPFRSLKSRLVDPFMGTITRVKTKAPVLALTFDDGPSPEYTPRILDLLAEYHAKATFFVVGKAVQQYPDVIARIRSAGHTLANHTYSHAQLTLLSSPERRREVRLCERALNQGGPRLFRPPWGVQSSATRFDLLRLGYRVVTWNVIVEDWLWQDPEKLANRIVSGASPGSIILLHDALIPRENDQDSCTDRSYLIDALAIALPKLVSEFQLITVPDMLQAGRPVYQKWLYDGID